MLLPHQRDQEAVRAQTERVPELRSSDVSLSGVRKRLLTKLRVHHGLLVSNMVEGHHDGVCFMLLAAVSAPRV